MNVDMRNINESTLSVPPYYTPETRDNKSGTDKVDSTSPCEVESTLSVPLLLSRVSSV